MFGNDEHDRWDQGATVGALLAAMGTMSFANGIPPKINYAAPDGKREAVSFTLHIPQGYSDFNKLIQSLYYALKKMSMDEGIGNTDAFKARIEANIGPIDWKNLKDSFYSDSFYMNTRMMQDFSNAKDTAAVLKIAKNSLLGMARQGVKDYTLHASPTALAGYLNDPKFAYVPDNTAYGTKGLKLGATLHLLKALDENPVESQLVINDLINNVDMKQKMPETVKVLQQALIGLKPPKEQFQELWDQKKYVEAYILADKVKDPLMTSQVLAAITDLIVDYKTKKSNYKELIELAKGFYQANNEKVAERIILKEITLDPFDKAYFENQKTIKLRFIHLDKLNANVAQLKTKVTQFDTNYKEIMDLCVKGLIGLSQFAQFKDANFGQFEGLNNYLGKPKYGYVFDNGHGDTQKLRKAAPLYIIKGMESANPDIRKEAFKALELLAADYLAAGKSSPHAADYEQALLAISRGYYDSMFGKDQAMKDLGKIWQKDAAILNKLVVNSGGAIPNTQLAMALS